jgi:nucleoside-diphosphate-sugar epimerase
MNALGKSSAAEEPRDLHVVFGAGQVGWLLAELLQTRGQRVRIVRRSAHEPPPAIDVRLGDAADRAFCVGAAEGAAAIYHCMNPPYDTKVWADLVPRYLENLIAAAGAARARLVVLDNLYMLGRPGGRALDEETPLNPCSRKGGIRARAAERLFEAHRRGEVRATAGHASDFYGPGGTRTHFGDFFWPRALAGKSVRMPMNLDKVHTYHYIPDVAAGLAALGLADEAAYGRRWMLPCAPANTTREIVARFSRHLDRTIAMARPARWVVKVTGLFVPIMREIDEMLYEWDEPFVVNDQRFRERFNLTPTDLDEGAGATVAWARRHYRGPSSNPS